MNQPAEPAEKGQKWVVESGEPAQYLIRRLESVSGIVWAQAEQKYFKWTRLSVFFSVPELSIYLFV